MHHQGFCTLQNQKKRAAFQKCIFNHCAQYIFDIQNVLIIHTKAGEQSNDMNRNQHYLSE